MTPEESRRIKREMDERGKPPHREIKQGRGCVIEDDVEIGLGTELGHFVVIRAGARIGQNCVINDHVTFTGRCLLGDGVTIKAGTVISRGCEIGPGAFLGANVTTGSTADALGGGLVKTRIGRNCLIYSAANIVPGVSIPDGTIIGAGSNVVKDIPERGVWVGNPARKVKDAPDELLTGTGAKTKSRELSASMEDEIIRD